MLAIGKESVPVRIAELMAGAEAILFASKKELHEKSLFCWFTCNVSTGSSRGPRVPLLAYSSCARCMQLRR